MDPNRGYIVLRFDLTYPLYITPYNVTASLISIWLCIIAFQGLRLLFTQGLSPEETKYQRAVLFFRLMAGFPFATFGLLHYMLEIGIWLSVAAGVVAYIICISQLEPEYQGWATIKIQKVEAREVLEAGEKQTPHTCNLSSTLSAHEEEDSAGSRERSRSLSTASSDTRASNETILERDPASHVTGTLSVALCPHCARGLSKEGDKPFTRDSDSPMETTADIVIVCVATIWVFLEYFELI